MLAKAITSRLGTLLRKMLPGPPRKEPPSPSPSEPSVEGMTPALQGLDSGPQEPAPSFQPGTASTTPEHTSYELVPLIEWPVEGGKSSWEADAVTARFKRGVEAFDLKADESAEVAFQNPVVRDNLEALARTGLTEATVLDYGCGNAVYLSLLSSFPATKSWKYVGADINAGLIEWCCAAHPGTRFEHIRKESNALPFRDGEFDVVLASGVIHCIRDYYATLSELHRVTNNYVLLSRVLVWKYNPHQIFRQTVYHKWGTENHTIHVFNRDTLEEALQRSGFVIVYRDYSCLYLYIPNSKEVIVYHLYLLQKKTRSPDS